MRAEIIYALSGIEEAADWAELTDEYFRKWTKNQIRLIKSGL